MGDEGRNYLTNADEFDLLNWRKDMITPRENMLRYFRGEDCEWTPSSLDQLCFRPACIPENIARGMTMQQTPYKGEYGGHGFFGVEWVFDPNVSGSIEKVPLLADIIGWGDKVRFPNIDEIDWELCAKENEDYLKTDKMIYTTIYSSFFERLISFVGFENAAMALIDEDQRGSVKMLFDRLADFYIELISRLRKHFGVELIEFHDDWGTQISTFFSVETHKEMIAPYLKRVVDSAHMKGVFVELHSCGKIDRLIPNIISAGIDTWRGQAIVDKKRLVDEFSGVFKFGVEIKPEMSVSDSEAIALVEEALQFWHGKNVWLFIARTFTPAQKGLIYQYIRERKVI